MLAYLNDFEINSATNRFYLSGEIDGLAMPPIRTSSGVYSGQDGGYVGAQFFGMRQISMQGTAYGSDIAEIEAKRVAIQAAIVSKTVTLEIITNAGANYLISCNLLKFDMPITKDVNIAPFMIELLAPDPIIYDNSTGGLITAVLTRATGGGYVFPIVYPVIWNPSSPPTTINNSGTAEILPTVTITGTATNPKITNLTTGEFFQMTGLTVGSGSTLVIDMKNRSVLLDGGNVFYKVSSTSKWWALGLGANNILFETDSGGDTGTATVSYRPGYLGI